MLTILGGIAILGILVFVHELGHFTVAKLAGVKVLKFSLGFGPRLLSRQWGETEYMICAIPLGGYVLMLGEGGGVEGEAIAPLPGDEGRSFAAKSVGIRSLIIAAGPLTNLILPFLVLPLAYMLGVSVPAHIEQPATPGYVVAGSPAAGAGFQANDRIVAINDSPVTTWESANNILLSHAGSTLKFEVRRAGESRSLALADGGIDGLMALGSARSAGRCVGAGNARRESRSQGRGSHHCHRQPARDLVVRSQGVDPGREGGRAELSGPAC
jgi:regulator of sigma E protease